MKATTTAALASFGISALLCLSYRAKRRGPIVLPQIDIVGPVKPSPARRQLDLSDPWQSTDTPRKLDKLDRLEPRPPKPKPDAWTALPLAVPMTLQPDRMYCAVVELTGWEATFGNANRIRDTLTDLTLPDGETEIVWKLLTVGTEPPMGLKIGRADDRYFAVGSPERASMIDTMPSQIVSLWSKAFLSVQT